MRINQEKNPVCVSFNSQINPNTASPLMAVLSERLNQGHHEIHLFVNTPGGTVHDGIALYNFIRALPIEVVTYNIGNVNSIGNVLYQAGRHRVCARISSFMFHGIGFDVSSHTRFEQKNMKERLQGLRNDQNMVSEIMAERTGIPLDEVNRLFLEMQFLRADEALQRGMADEVTDINLPAGLPMVQLVFQG